MISVLHRPLKPESALLVAAALLAANALYCVGYNALAGRTESLGNALLWALVNVLPWYGAFEAGKRATSLRGIGLVLAAAAIISMLLHVAAHGWPDAFGFELLRRLPGALVTAGMLASGRAIAAREAERSAAATRQVGLPVAPAEVDWVCAAGNYVELRSAGRTILHRAPLSRVQVELESHGFVRIHRSLLVRRERIARVRPSDVILHDGTSLKTGKRYRGALR